jgi:hypothetical protein
VSLQLQVCAWHVSYCDAQLAATHVEHALLVASLQSLEQLVCRHVPKAINGADAVGQLWTKHACSQSGADTWRPPPSVRLPPQLCMHVSIELQSPVPVPNMSGAVVQKSAPLPISG